MRKIIITILLLAVPATPAHSKANTEQRCPKWEPLMQKYNLPIKGKVNFSYLAWRESRCISRAVGWNLHKGASIKDCRNGRYHVMRKCSAVKSWDVGVLQINSSWYTLTTKICGKNTHTKVLMKPECNIKVAAYLYHKGGGAANWGYPSDRPSRKL